MGRAKDIVIKPIEGRLAAAFMRRAHYSRKAVKNSMLHFGVFLGDRLEGALQFGPPMNKRGTLNLVKGTSWHGMLELNRMAFTERLPRNSESRALGVVFRIIRREYPDIEWVVSFSDACQCGDGAIYRASGFVLTAVKKNTTILRLPNGTVIADKTLNNPKYKTKGQSAGWWKRRGAVALAGFQLRYVYFLNASARDRLTVPILPFSTIDERGARMYLGRAPKRDKQAMAGPPAQRRGSTDRHAPQSQGADHGQG